jgi:hypothetical protein
LLTLFTFFLFEGATNFKRRYPTPCAFRISAGNSSAHHQAEGNSKLEIFLDKKDKDLVWFEKPIYIPGGFQAFVAV